MQQSARRRPRTVGVGAGLLLGLLVPSAAHAAVTTTRVTSPAPDTMHSAVFDGVEQTREGFALHVEGVAPGAADGDELQIVCTSTSASDYQVRFLGPATVQDEAFDVDVDTDQGACRLRAIPVAVTDPSSDADLSAFSGPRLLGGALRRTGSQNGSLDGYQVTRAQGRGLLSAVGTSAFPQFGGLLFVGLLEDTRITPAMTPFAYASDMPPLVSGEKQAGTRYPALEVDGRRAGLVAAVGDVQSRVLDRRVDPRTGVLTVTDEAPIVFADAQRFREAEATGLVRQRTITQDQDGRRVRVADRYVSVDGLPHSVAARYLGNTGAFGDAGVAVNVPWRTGDRFEDVADAAYGAPTAAGPAIVRLRAGTSTAGASSPGPALALVFDAGLTDLRTTSPGVVYSAFEEDVPADGSVTFGQTLLQDATTEGLERLIVAGEDPGTDAPAAPSMTAPPPAAAPPSSVPPQATPAGLPVPVVPPTPRNPLPRLASITGRVLVIPAHGRRLRDGRSVSVVSSGVPAGRYGVSIRRRVPGGRTLADGVRVVRTAGTLKVILRPTRYGRSYLGKKRARGATGVPVRVVVTWTPPGERRVREQTSYPLTFR